MTVHDPVIGCWFRKPDGSIFEVVAIDEDSATVEIQQFDGTIDEIDMETWPSLMVVEVAAPEDWSGSVDMDPDDYGSKKDDGEATGYQDPLDFLDEI